MNHVNEQVLGAFTKRFTCKRYDPQAHISDEDFATILEVARLSPSSMGMEPWRLLVIENIDLLSKIQTCAWGAKKHADRTVVILARRDLRAKSAYAHHIWSDIQKKTNDEIEALEQKLDSFQRYDFRLFDTSRALLDWARCQTYIVLADMLYTAALLGIDATPIEGFNAADMDALLAHEGVLDPEVYAVSVLVQFGKADPSHLSHPKWRRPADEVIAYV